MGPVTSHSTMSGTAHEKLKQASEVWTWKGLAVAVLLHLVFLLFGPGIHVNDSSSDRPPVARIQLPPTVDIPPPPAAIARPAAPFISTEFEFSDLVTVPGVTSTSYELAAALPPPEPAKPTEDLSSAPRYTPYSVPPRLLNGSEVLGALRAHYRSARPRGAGTVIVWFFIDQAGNVRNALIKEPSRFPGLNDAALTIAPLMRFSPAESQGNAVAVWVALPITFI